MLTLLVYFSCVGLAQKCTIPAFRMHLRAHGTVTKIFGCLQDAAADPVSSQADNSRFGFPVRFDPCDFYLPLCQVKIKSVYI